MSAFLEEFVAGKPRPAGVNPDPYLMGVGDVEVPEEAAIPPSTPLAEAPAAEPEVTPFLAEFQNAGAAEGAVAGIEALAAPVDEGADPLEVDAQHNAQQALARDVYDVPSGPMPEGEVDEARAVAQRFAGAQRAALPAHAAGLQKKTEGLARFLESKRLGGAMQGAMRPEDAEGIVDEATGRAAIRGVKPFPSATPYDTKLSPAEDAEFRKWKAQYAPRDSGEDYDLRGAFKAGFKPDARGHWPDTFKKPNHPTFSNESNYAKVRPELAGRWEGEKFFPSPYQADQERIAAFEMEQVAKEAQAALAKKEEFRKTLGHELNPYDPAKALADIDRKAETRAAAILGAARAQASKAGTPLAPEEEQEAQVNAYRRAYEDAVREAIVEREASLEKRAVEKQKLDEEWRKAWEGAFSNMAPPPPLLTDDPLADPSGPAGEGAQMTQEGVAKLETLMWAGSLPFVAAEDLAGWILKQAPADSTAGKIFRSSPVGMALESVAPVNKALASPFHAMGAAHERLKEKSPYLFSVKGSKPDDWFSPATRGALARGGELIGGLALAKGLHGAAKEARAPMRPIGDTGFSGKQVRPGNTGNQILKVMKDRDMPQSPGDAAREGAQRQAMKEMGPTGAPEARKAEAAAAGRYARALEDAARGETPVDAPLAELGSALEARRAGVTKDGLSPAEIKEHGKYIEREHERSVREALAAGRVEDAGVAAEASVKAAQAEVAEKGPQRAGPPASQQSQARARLDGRLREAGEKVSLARSAAARAAADAARQRENAKTPEERAASDRVEREARQGLEDAIAEAQNAVREVNAEVDASRRGPSGEAVAEGDRAVREAGVQPNSAPISRPSFDVGNALAEADRSLREQREALQALDADRSMAAREQAAGLERQIADLERRRAAALEKMPQEVQDAARALDEARAARERTEGGGIRAREALADDIQRRERGPSYEELRDQEARDMYAGSLDAQFERAIDAGTRERPQFQNMAGEAYAQVGFEQERTRAHEEATDKALRAAQEKKERRQAKLRRTAPALETAAGREAEVDRAKAIVNRRFDAELQQRAQERAALLARIQAGGRSEFNAVELGQERLWMRSFRERRLRALEKAEDNARNAIHRMVTEHRRFEREGNALTKAEADAIRAKHEREAVARVESERDMSSGQHAARARGHTAANVGELDAARAGAKRIAEEEAKAAAAGQRRGTPAKRPVAEPIIGGEEAPLSPEEAAAEVDRISRAEPLIVPPGWRPPQDTVAVPESGVESIMRQNAEERNARNEGRQALAARRVGAPLADAPDISGEQARVAIPTAEEVATLGKQGLRPGVARERPTITQRGPEKKTPFKRPPEGGAGPVTILGPDGKPTPSAPKGAAPAPKGPAPIAAGAERANKHPGVARELVAGLKSVGVRMRKLGRAVEGNVAAKVTAGEGGVYDYVVEVDGKPKASGRAASFDKAAAAATEKMLEELAAQAKTPEVIEAAADAAGPLPPADAAAAPKTDIKAEPVKGEAPPAAGGAFQYHEKSGEANNWQGWKIHLNVDADPALAAEIGKHLEARGIRHKIGKAGDQEGKGMTVYVGARDALTKVAGEINDKFGSRLKDAVGDVLNDDVRIAGPVWARFDVQQKGARLKYHQYGKAGVPYLLDDFDRIVSSNYPEGIGKTKGALPAGFREEAMRRADAALTQEFGEFYKGGEAAPKTDIKAPAPEAPKAPPVTRSSEDFIADLEQRTGIRPEVPAEVAENLKERFGSKRPADAAKAEARRKLDVKDPDYWIERLEDAVDAAKAEGVPPAIREKVLAGIKNPARRAGVRAAMSDPAFRAEDASLVGATTSKLMEGHDVADIGVKAAREGFDAAAKVFVEESARLKRMPRGFDLMESIAQRLIAGEDPLDVLRDALRVETEGAKARATPEVKAPKVPPVADRGPAPVAERKVPAPMRKPKVAEGPVGKEGDPTASPKSDAFAPDDLQTPFDGDTGPIFDSKGTKYRFSMERVDPRMIKGSFADAKGTKTEGYPEGFQARKFNEGKVKEIVDGFDADKLGTSDTSPVVGGPVLWRDPRTGTYYVPAGNHRYLGGQLANYYADGVPRPFRVLQEPYGRAKTFAAFSQDSPAAKMTLAERARAAAVGFKLGIDHTPGALPSEPLDATNVRKFLERPENRRFTERVFPEGIPADKFAEDTLFQTEAALLGLMPEGVRTVIETAADKTVEAIMAATPALLAMRSKAVRGLARSEFDLLGYFERAAQAFKHVESKKMTPGQLAQHIRDLAETNDLAFDGASGRDVSPLSHLDPLDAGFLIALSKTESLQNPRSYFVEAIKKLDALSQEHTPGQTSIFGGGIEEVPVSKILDATFGPQITKMVEKYIDVRARNGETTRLIRVEDPEKTVFGTGEDTTVASPAANAAVKAVDAMSQPKVGKPKKGKKKGGEAGAALHGGPIGWLFAGIGSALKSGMAAYEARIPAAARAEMGALEGARRPLPTAAKAIGRSASDAYEGGREFGDIYASVRGEPGIGNAKYTGADARKAKGMDLQVDLKDSVHGLMNADEVATEKAMEIRNAVKNRESLVLAARATIYRDLLRMVEENEDLPRKKAYAQSEIQRIMAIRRGRLNGELTRAEREVLDSAKAMLREEPRALSGHTPVGIRSILAEVETELASRPDAQEAVRLTRAALDEAAADMKVIDPGFSGKRDYFPHHIIFEHTLDAPPSTGSSGPVKRPFLKAKVHRGGTERPFDVDVAEVVYKHVRDIKRAKVLHDFYEKFRVSANNLLPEVLRTGKLPDGLTPADVSMWSFNRTPTKQGVPVELAHDRAAATAAVRGAIASGVNPGEVLRQFNRGRVQPYVLVKTNVARALDGATEFAHIPSDNIAMIVNDMSHAIFRWTTLTARGGMDFIERNFGGDMVNLMTHVPRSSAEVLRAPIETAIKPFNFMARSIIEKMTGKEDPVLHRARQFNAYQSGLWGSALEARHRGSIERMVTGKEGPREPWHVLSPAAKMARIAVSIPMAPFSIVGNLRVALEASTRMQACEALVREGYNLNAARVLGNQVLVDYSLLSRNAKLTRRLLAPYLAFVLQTSNNFLFPKVRSRATVFARVASMVALPMLYNWAVTPDMERELSPKIQATPHINIGRDKDGKVVSVNLPGFGLEPPVSAKILAGIAAKMASYAFDEETGDTISRIAGGAFERAGEDVLGMTGPAGTAGAALMFGKDIRTLEDLDTKASERGSDAEIEYANFVKYGVPIRNPRVAKALSSFTGIFRPPTKGIMAAPGVEKVVDGTKVGEFYKRYEKLNPKATEQAREKFIGGSALVPAKAHEPYERGLELREEEGVATMRAFADLLDRQRQPGADKAKLDAEKKKILAKMKELRLTPNTVRQFIRGRGRDAWKANQSEDKRKKLMNQRFAPSAPEPRKE